MVLRVFWVMSWYCCFFARNEAVIEGVGSYWGECFTVADPVPQFLEPFLDQVMLTGKSTQLIESTGKVSFRISTLGCKNFWLQKYSVYFQLWLAGFPIP